VLLKSGENELKSRAFSIGDLTKPLAVSLLGSGIARVRVRSENLG
jgi:hypothetical protein